MLAAPLLLAPSSVTLRFQPPVGKTYTYSMHGVMNQSAMGRAMNATTDAKTAIKILSRKGDVTTLETAVSGAKITVPQGSPMAGQTARMAQAMNGRKSQLQIDSHYKPIGTMGGQTGQMFGSFQFPSKPVRVGESWNFNMTLPTGIPSASGTIPVKITLQSVSGNVATLKISMNGTVTVGGGPQGQSIKLAVSGNGSSSFEVSSGMFLAMDVTTVTKSQGQMAFSMSMHQVMKRI